MSTTSDPYDHPTFPQTPPPPPPPPPPAPPVPPPPPAPPASGALPESVEKAIERAIDGARKMESAFQEDVKDDPKKQHLLPVNRAVFDFARCLFGTEPGEQLRQHADNNRGKDRKCKTDWFHNAPKDLQTIAEAALRKWHKGIPEVMRTGENRDFDSYFEKFLTRYLQVAVARKEHPVNEAITIALQKLDAGDLSEEALRYENRGYRMLVCVCEFLQKMQNERTMEHAPFRLSCRDAARAVTASGQSVGRDKAREMMHALANRGTLELESTGVSRTETGPGEAASYSMPSVLPEYIEDWDFDGEPFDGEPDP